MSLSPSPAFIKNCVHFSYSRSCPGLTSLTGSDGSWCGTPKWTTPPSSCEMSGVSYPHTSLHGRARALFTSHGSTNRRGPGPPTTWVCSAQREPGCTPTVRGWSSVCAPMLFSLELDNERIRHLQPPQLDFNHSLHASKLVHEQQKEAAEAAGQHRTRGAGEEHGQRQEAAASTEPDAEAGLRARTSLCNPNPRCSPAGV